MGRGGDGEGNALTPLANASPARRLTKEERETEQEGEQRGARWTSSAVPLRPRVTLLLPHRESTWPREGTAHSESGFMLHQRR